MSAFNKKPVYGNCYSIIVYWDGEKGSCDCEGHSMDWRHAVAGWLAG